MRAEPILAPLDARERADVRAAAGSSGVSLRGAAGARQAAWLEVLELVWLGFAANARDRELAVPGGYPKEQQRQVDRLKQIAGFVREASPDVELERLWQENDHEGWLRHLRSYGDGD